MKQIAITVFFLQSFVVHAQEVCCRNQFLNPKDSIVIVEYGDSLNFVVLGILGNKELWSQRIDAGQTREIKVDLAGVKIQFDQFDFFNLIPNQISIEDSRDSLSLMYSFAAKNELNDSTKDYERIGFYMTESAFSRHGIGNIKRYYANGQISFESETLNGSLHGTAHLYYENGNLQKIEHWKNGKVDGLHLSFNMDGVIIIQRNFKMSIPDGVHAYYSDKGELIKLERWIDGIKVE